MHRQKGKSISSKGDGDTDRERGTEGGRKRDQYIDIDRQAHGRISVLGHRHDMPVGKFLLPIIPSWNIRCVLRSRLKLVSRERKMIMLMLSRKMLMLRRRMLRRKTDEARTQTYTLCEPAQPKCISTCHKSRTIRKFTGNKLQTRVRSTQIRHLPLHLL